MLDPQVVVNLFLQVFVGVKLVNHNHSAVLITSMLRPSRERLK